MEDARFDDLSRRVASRRTALGGLAAIATLALALTPEALVGKKKKKKKKPKKCAAGAIRCGTACVNPRTDAQNCGRCGNRCGQGAACAGGTCQPPVNDHCPDGQIRCSGQCVDPSSDEAHCGDCGQQCQGELTCLGGTCSCAGSGVTQCGNRCVNTQTDEDHCGACGNPCPTGQTCRQGTCGSAPCDNDQRQCSDGTCIPAGSEYCCVDYDCGQYTGDLHCRNNVCVCREQGEGICRRYAGGGGLCDVCCPGGTASCPGDQICVEGTTPDQRFCSCPPGKQRCAGSQNSFLCQDSVGNDQDRCGLDCVNCDNAFPGSVCCNGRCIKGCEPGATCPPSTPCTNCQPCPEGTMCCNQGSGNLFGCVVPDNLNRCPIPEN